MGGGSSARIGVCLVGVGLYFVIKGLRAKFRDELEPGGVGPFSHEAIVTLGRVGWVGRGIVMALVGWFLTSAAVQFRPEEAKGFDGSLRELTEIDARSAGRRVRRRRPHRVRLVLRDLGPAATAHRRELRPGGRRAGDARRPPGGAGRGRRASGRCPVRRPRLIRLTPPPRSGGWSAGSRRHPRLGAPARAIDQQVVGGLMLVVALAIVFVTALVVGIVFDMVDRDSGLARWDTAVAEWGSENATSWSTNVLDALTDLGGTRLPRRDLRRGRDLRLRPSPQPERRPVPARRARRRVDDQQRAQADRRP